MAVVYLAQDLRHDRPVALKILLPELAATLGPERFQREIKLAARLQHPHILTVHDSGEAAGQLWFTMPYVEGESLRDRLRREHQLPLDDALRIADEAARALDYAHQHGVVHRDIKPENILLTKDGSTLVADFGIARALGNDEGLTQTGMAVGTPAYMSPEQAAGDKTIDARTDQYSLASMLYEMLAGEAPFTGPTIQAIMAKRLSTPPPSVRVIRPAVPAAVDDAIRKALAPIAADRFAGVAQFARALADRRTGEQANTVAMTSAARSDRPFARSPVRHPVAIALTAGLLIGGGVLFAWRRSASSHDSAGGARVVAVLPFENLGDPSDAYFADGITDEVRGKLAQVAGLAVIARASSNEYRGTTKPPQQIARELSADYLLTATVRWEKSGGASRVRVSPELIRVEPGAAPTTRWQQPFDAALTDVFQVQADIAAKVATALDLALGSSQRQALIERPTENLAAYDAYLRGNEAAASMVTASTADLRHAIQEYERAVALDSAFAPAWARLSRANSRLYSIAAPTSTDAERAGQAAERALALAPGLAEAHLALGEYYDAVYRDQARVLEQYALGRRLAPNDVDLLVATALAQEAGGDWEGGLATLRQARALDPRSVSTARRLAYTLVWLRRYPEAHAAADEGLALDPANLDIRETKAIVHLAEGDLAGARAVYSATPKEVDPTAVVADVATFWDLAWALDEEQQQLLLRLTPAAFDNNRGSWGLALAQIYDLRGDRTRARAYADSARADFETQLKVVPEDAQLHALHGVVLAYMGRKTEAVREGEWAVARRPMTKDAYGGAYLEHLFARIYVLSDEHEKALDKLELLLKLPYFLSPGWLRIDPNFDQLRKNPRFMKLVEETA